MRLPATERDARGHPDSVVAGIRRDGRPQLSPNWFYWDGERFYVSTTRDRVKYAIFSRDPAGAAAHRRSHRLPRRPDPRHCPDPRGSRRGTAPLPCHQEKHGMAVPDDDEHKQKLARDGRILLAITPDGPPSGWTSWGLD